MAESCMQRHFALKVHGPLNVHAITMTTKALIQYVSELAEVISL